MELKLRVKPFSFELQQQLKTSHGIITKKQGWLINLEDKLGGIGWGEIAPFNIAELTKCEKILADLGVFPSRKLLENGIKQWPGSLGFAIGTALAEVDNLVGNKSVQDWLRPSSSAILLPTKDSLILNALDLNLKEYENSQKNPTFKWKVAIHPNKIELDLLKTILSRLPTNSRLRIDANGGWDRRKANEWAQKLHKEPRLEWLEQPLPANDIEGLSKLATQIPVALDESLLYKPSLRETWKSWQIRRPSLEGDPRNLLKKLNNKNHLVVISTAFETGIGFRWIEHLAALQQKNSNPIQPGLAPGWCPSTQLFSEDPYLVWDAA